MVIDSSAIIALFFEEQHADWVTQQLDKHAAAILMSTVNLAETLIIAQDRSAKSVGTLRQLLLSSGIQFEGPTVNQAELAAQARMRFPLNLGDCFAYALAKDRECGLITLDKDFKKSDLQKLLLPS